MITAIFVFLAVVLVHGWYRACWDVAQQKWAKKEIVCVVEQAPPHLDIRQETRLSRVGLMTERGSCERSLVDAYITVIRGVLDHAAKYLILTEEEDDYAGTIRVGARLRLIPPSGSGKAGHSLLQDDKSGIPALDIILARSSEKVSLLRALRKCARGGA